MMTPQQEIAEKYTKLMMYDIDAAGEYYVIVPVDDRWSEELPEHVKPHQVMKLDIRGWTRANTVMDDDGVHMTVAFGEKEDVREAQASFKFEEILEIGDSQHRALFRRVFKFEEPKPVKTSYTLKNMIAEADKSSMDAMKKNNPNMSKKKG